jgi:hypothetical protein
MDQQINVTQLAYFVALAVVVLGVLWNNRKSTNDIVAVFEKAIDNLTTNPVFIQNAKGATESVPQDVFMAVYSKLDAAEGFIGESTRLGVLLQRLEDALKLVDKDPTNDPIKTGETPVDNG